MSTRVVQATPIPSPSETPTLSPSSATATPSPGPTSSPTLAIAVFPEVDPVSENAFDVRFHPDGGLIAGDQISIEVIAPQDEDLNEKEVVVAVEGPVIEQFEPAGFGRFGIGGRHQATLYWVWDTSDLDPDDYQLTFSIEPGGPTWTETVTLLPSSSYAFPEPLAAWTSLESDCCTIFYITGTAAAREIENLADTADAQADRVMEKMGVEFTDTISVVFLSRVMGHGGFAGERIFISFLDRNYAGNAPAQVLHHEMVHILDGRLESEIRPTMFVEGLATYLSDGHFKKEPLLARAATLDNLGWYIPFESLVDDFYSAQHEISYLEAASLIEYMVGKWGWDAFDNFYRDIQPHPSDLPSAAIDAALQEHFGLTLEELEDEFLQLLKNRPPDPDMMADVRVTVNFFDSVRRYQQVLDTSAYFLTAWLPDFETMRERRIVADYLRHPTRPENLALETLLISAHNDYINGRYGRAEVKLEAVNAVLNALERGSESAFYVHPLASDYMAIVLEVQDLDLVPHQIEIFGEQAKVWVTSQGVELLSLDFVREDVGWTLQ